MNFSCVSPLVSGLCPETGYEREALPRHHWKIVLRQSLKAIPRSRAEPWNESRQPSPRSIQWPPAREGKGNCWIHPDRIKNVSFMSKPANAVGWIARSEIQPTGYGFWEGVWGNPF